MNLVIMSFTFFTVNLRKGSDLNSDLRAPGSFEPKQKQILKLFMFPILIVPVPSVGANKYGARPIGKLNASLPSSWVLDSVRNALLNIDLIKAIEKLKFNF